MTSVRLAHEHLGIECGLRLHEASGNGILGHHNPRDDHALDLVLAAIQGSLRAVVGKPEARTEVFYPRQSGDEGIHNGNRLGQWSQNRCRHIAPPELIPAKAPVGQASALAVTLANQFVAALRQFREAKAGQAA